MQQSILRVSGFAVLAAVVVTAGSNVHAQEEESFDIPSGIAEYVQLAEDQDVPNGSIISLIDGQYRLADQPYTPSLSGVHVERPALALSKVGRTGAFPVSNSGVALVRVTTQNGPIAEGDFVTASTNAGVGMLATQSGYVLGTALDPFNENEEGLIQVALDIKFVTPVDRENVTPRSFLSQAQDVATIGLRAIAAAEPNTTLRYLLAAAVLIASILFGFLLFGRSATNSLIAVGRNPLAKRSIFAMMIFNISMTLGFAGVGLILAIAILAL